MASATFKAMPGRQKFTSASGGNSAKDVVVVRSGAAGYIGVVVADIAGSGTGQIDTDGVFEFPKATGSTNTFAIGDIAYWDVSDGNMQKVASANVRSGVCVEAAAAAATTVKVRIFPGKDAS